MNDTKQEVFTLARAADTPFAPAAFEQLGVRVSDFALARMVGWWNRSGHPPKVVRLEVRVVCEDDADLVIATSTKPLTLDGLTRARSIVRGDINGSDDISDNRDRA